MLSRSSNAVLGAALCLLAAVVFSSPQRVQAQAQTAQVTVSNPSGSGDLLAYTPSSVTIIQGDSVNWCWATNNGSGTCSNSTLESHSVTSGSCPGGTCTADGNFASATQFSGSFSHTFPIGTGAKVFPYFCAVHLSLMQGSVTVLAFGSANHFVVTPLSTPTAGTSFNLTVTAEDRNGNVVTTYGNNITSVTSTAGGVSTFSNGGFSGGSETLHVTLTVAGGQTLTISNADGSGTAFVTVQPALVNRFSVVAPSTATTGSNVNVTVTAFDQFNNAVTNYESFPGQEGNIHFTSTDGVATLPNNPTAPGGSAGFGVIFNTAGSQTITVCDTIRTGACGTSNTIVVNPANCPAADKTFSNTTAINIPDVSSASPFPSTITVSMPGVVVGKLTVTLHGFNHTFASDLDVLLVAPGGQEFILMSDAAGGEDSNAHSNPIDLTFDDAAAAALPANFTVSNTNPLLAGTYKPTANALSGRPLFNNTGSPPPPGSPYNLPAPAGTSTLESAFSGINPNGVWKLYIQDNVGGDFGAVNGGWSIDITPAFQFTNTNSINFTATPQSTNPYPSSVSVSGLQGNITKLTLTLNGLNDICPANDAILLQAPGGQIIAPFSGVGDCTGTAKITTPLVLSDSAIAALPEFSNPLSSGLFKPTSDIVSRFGSTVPLAFIAPAPGGPYPESSLDGSATFASQFNGSDPNGLWKLYVLVQDQLGSVDSGSFSGWSLQFQLACPPTSACAVTPNPVSPSAFNQTVTFTAAVTTGGATPVTLGNVQFFDGASPVGAPQNLNASGQAQLVFSNGTLAVGSHSITAQYNANFNNNTSFQPSTSPAVNYTVAQASTSSGVVTSGTPVNFPAQVTFTATVTPQFPGVEPGGSVTFKDAGVALGAASGVNGLNPDQAVFTTAAGQLNHGTHSITAVYGGDTNFTASATSPAINQVVNPATTATALGSSLNPANYGDNLTFTATVSAPGCSANPASLCTPTPGSVTFTDTTTSTTLATVTTSNGVATTPAISTLSTGTHNITASYAGSTDGNFAASSIALSPAQTINKDATTSKVTLSPSFSTQQFGSSITVTAKLTGSTGSLGRTGMVSFTDNGTPIGSVNLAAIPPGCVPPPASGNPCLPNQSFAVGNHSFIATYSGDNNYAGGASSPVPLHIIGGTNTAVVTNPSTSFFGQSVSLTASVTCAVNGCGTPTGTVQFYNNGTSCPPSADGMLLGSAALSGGSANISTSALPPGTDLIVACYLGSTDFAVSDNTLTPATQTVNAATTATALALGEVAPAPPGQDLARHPLTLTATVTVTGGSGTPTGAVTFTDNGAALTTPVPCTLSAKGANTSTCTVTLTLGLGAVGRHSLVADYAGNGSFAASNSGATVVIEYRSPKPH